MIISTASDNYDAHKWGKDYNYRQFQASVDQCCLIMIAAQLIVIRLWPILATVLFWYGFEAATCGAVNPCDVDIFTKPDV